MVDKREEERRNFVMAFNSTMIKIWKEKIALLGVVDTGRLYSSVIATRMNADGKFTSATFEQRFLQYGLYADYGVGSNTPRGNPGDIGRDNPRKRRQWFSKKYYASVMKIREFFADNLGKDLADVVSNALSPAVARKFLP